MIFNPHKVYKYFKDTYVLGKRSAKGWFSLNCPFCGKDHKGAVNIEWGYFKCWSCSAACNVAQFVQETEHVDYYTAKQILNSVVPSSLDLDILSDIVTDTISSAVTLPDGWQSIIDGEGIMGDRARRYLESRGYDLEVLDFKGFGYCNKHHEDKTKDFFGYIIVPFKKDGILSYYLGRDYIGNFLRYKNPPIDFVGVGKSEVIYNEEALHLYKTVYIVEGWSDAEMIGKRGTATLGWNMSKTQLDKYFKSAADKLVFIPDAGTDSATGQSYYQKAMHVAMGFIESNKRVFVVDLNGLKEGAKDVCEIGWERVFKHYKEHTQQLTWNLAMSILTT